ncbi:hypothetical protein DXG01_015544, partial [Tephrocybe rancida]
ERMREAASEDGASTMSRKRKEPPRDHRDSDRDRGGRGRGGERDRGNKDKDKDRESPLRPREGAGPWQGLCSRQELLPRRPGVQASSV